MSDKIFDVKYGSIYKNSTGCVMGTMAFIVDINTSALKYGDVSIGLDSYYFEMVDKYNKRGLYDIANDLIYIEFDRYEGVLTIEEMCIFANYIVMCSCNGQDILKMLNMEVLELKDKLKLLSEFGY